MYNFIQKNVVFITSLIIALVAILIMTKKKSTNKTSSSPLSSDLKYSLYNMDNDQNSNLKANNPGNIRDSPNYEFKGQTGRDYRGFCTFQSIEYGWRAMIKLLWMYNQKGLNTIRKICNTYAPPVENDTRYYAQTVSNHSGIALDTVLNWSDKNEITKVIIAMSHMENSIRPTYIQMQTAWELANDGQKV